MQNKHLEHPEDSVISGDLNVLNWFTANGNISAKIDGSPAIVWGTNPATNLFFVGTKSVFNKKLIKINSSHADIDNNHQGEVATILHHCLDNLPRSVTIYQGDFIGFGGSDNYNPNTIRYFFQDKVTEEIIIAPHTYYIAESDLRDAVAFPLESNLESDENVLFIMPEVGIIHSSYLTEENVIERCNFARQISTLCEFPETNRQIANIKKQINACIRNEVELDDLTLEAIANDNNCDLNVLRLWKLVQSIKMDMLYYIDHDRSVECYIEEERCGHEGYVLSNDYGSYKIVDRERFSCKNFNLGVQS
jgi:hypothetical protein